MRLAAALVLLLVAPGCGEKRDTSDDSHFAAQTGLALELALTGAARYWCFAQPARRCELHLLPSGKDGSLELVVAGARPALGAYPVGETLDPSGQGMTARFVTGERGGHRTFVARGGSVVITESTTRQLAGTFELEAVGTEAVSGVRPPLTIRGGFRARCEPQPGSSHACE